MNLRASTAGVTACAVIGLVAPHAVAKGPDEPPADVQQPGLALRPGGWSYFADPRAMRYAGADHAAWATMDGRIQIAKLSGKAVRVDTLADGLKPDDHSSPALALLPGGPLAAFWSPHLPQKRSGTDAMYYRVRVHGSWGRRHKIATNSRGQFGYAYPNPVRVGRRLMLFWRGGNYQPTYSATRNGRTWSDARTLLTGPQIGTKHPNRRERPYVKYYGDRGIVHVAYNEAHPSRRATSLFYVRMRGSRIVDADNVLIGHRPLRWDQGSEIYSGDEGSAWVMDVAATTEGSPVIVYIREKGRRAVQYRYVTWKDGAWQDRAICTSERLRRNGSYPGGLTIDHRDPRIVYVSRKVDSRFEIEAWATADSGETWAREPLTTKSETDSIRPTSALGGSTVLWMSGTYAHYTRFNTRIVMAEARARAEKRRTRRKRAAHGDHAGRAQRPGRRGD